MRSVDILIGVGAVPRLENNYTTATFRHINLVLA